MDNHKKSNLLGVESHGSHLCNKCGWNFPNPHPSAKHRRAHKRVCGKIDDLAEHSLTGVSDDDRALYEDPLTPSPKLENRLEDHVLVGSVMEFSESGLKPSGKCEVEEALAVVDNATEEQMKVVDTAEDCIVKPYIEKEGCLDHNLDVLETQENHLGRTKDAASEEIASVATPSLENTSVEITDFNVAPSKLVERYAKEAKVEDLNLGSMEEQDFCSKGESHQEEEDNSLVDESVHVFHTKEAIDELSTRNNTEVNLEEDAKDRETTELEKSPQILSSLKDGILFNGKGENSRGLAMDDEKIEIHTLHGNNDDAEFSSTADAILTVSNIEKEGSNLDETPTNELDSTSIIGNTMAEVHPNEEQIEIPHVDILTVVKTKVSLDSPCLEEEQEENNNISASSANKLYEAAAGTTYFDVAPPLENNTADNLKMMMIPESNSMNQIEKVVDKKDDLLLGDITGIKSMNLVPKPSQIPSQMVMDKHLSEDSTSNNHGHSVTGVSSIMNEFLNSEERLNNHLLAKQQQFDGSSSQGEDSVEGIWGSISVLSTQSDTQQYCLNPNPVAPSQPDTDKSDDAFEPPSFMTLVEDPPPPPQKGGEKQQQIVQKTQQQPMSELVLQAAFPSLTNTNITKETPGRKKNEEMISKVANWSMPKQHTPLKSLLLSDTTTQLINSSSSPTPTNWKKQQQTGTHGKEEENNSSLMKSTDDDDDQFNPSRKAMKEKKKVKGRPNWIQCVCCSSVH